MFHDGLLNYQVQPFPKLLLPLAVVGLLALLWRIRESLSQLLLVTVLYAPVSGAILSIGFPDEVPDPPRTVLLIVPACLFCATGADVIRRALSRFLPPPAFVHHATAVAVAAGLAVPLIGAWEQYLTETWPRVRRLGNVALYRDLASSRFNGEPAPALVGDWDPTSTPLGWRAPSRSRR